ncbi:MAG TPA: winged helix-turn-helix transcriptional regulator [Methanospirillum sp.]|nr:winged helix-turn-helix transcriptional regulator [Methanospirillum sp.]
MRSTSLGFALGLCLLSLSIPLDYNIDKPTIPGQESGTQDRSGSSSSGNPSPTRSAFPYFPGEDMVLVDFDQIERILRQHLRGYRRITAKNILDHETRRSLYELICSYPGIDLNGLVEMSGVNESTLRYHLDRIAEEQVITSITVGKSFHFFENHNKFSDEEQQFLSRFSTGQSGRILQTIRDHPGITRRDLAEFLGIASPTVTRTVQHLAQEGYIRLVKEGKYTRHFLPGQPMTLVHRRTPA